MRSRAAALILIAVVASSLHAQTPVARARQVTIRVLSEGEAAPLGYSVVAMPDLGLEYFTSASGRVVLPVRASGLVRLIVKRLGYVPSNTTIAVTDEPTQELTVALARLSLQLDAVRVADWPPCHDPGVPSPDRDPVGRSVLEQLRQNAERFTLLTRSYPFIYTSERVFSQRSADSTELVERSDTILVAGNPPWSYRPGTVVRRERRGFRSSSDRFTMRIPTLRDLGEDAFVAAHCFNVAGVEDKAGQQLLRIDIVADESLREPDVNVAVWLDPVDFRLRFATFVLTRIPPQLRNLRRVSSEITYLEIIPFVPVMYVTVGENVEQRPTGGRRVLLERQQVLDLRFLGAKPDGQVADPPPAVRRPDR